MADYKNTSKIIRQADVTKNFSIIPNHIAQSTELSPNAKSLIIHLLSMPDNWYYIKTQFWRKTNLGRGAFNNAWKELEEIGYICSERIIEGNLVRGYNYIISDLPILGCSEDWLNPPIDNPNIGKQLKTNTKQSTNKQSTNKERDIYKDSTGTNSTDTKPLSLLRYRISEILGDYKRYTSDIEFLILNNKERYDTYTSFTNDLQKYNLPSIIEYSLYELI